MMFITTNHIIRWKLNIVTRQYNHVLKTLCGEFYFKRLQKLMAQCFLLWKTWTKQHTMKAVEKVAMIDIADNKFCFLLKRRYDKFLFHHSRYFTAWKKFLQFKLFRLQLDNQCVQQWNLIKLGTHFSRWIVLFHKRLKQQYHQQTYQILSQHHNMLVTRKVFDKWRRTTLDITSKNELATIHHQQGK